MTFGQQSVSLALGGGRGNGQQSARERKKLKLGDREGRGEWPLALALGCCFLMKSLIFLHSVLWRDTTTNFLRTYSIKWVGAQKVGSFLGEGKTVQEEARDLSKVK